MSSTPILFVDHAAALGGAEHSLMLLLQHLDRQKWLPHLACTVGALADAAGQADIPCHLVSLPRLRRSWRFPLDWQRHARKLAQIAQQTEAAAIYANTVRAAVYAAPAARLAKRPFIWHMRDFWLSENRPRHAQADTATKQLLCRAAAQVLTNSQAVATHLPCPHKTAVVPNGIDINQFEPAQDGQPFRQQYHIPADAPLVGMVGRLRPWKGQTRFLQMAAQVSQQRPEAYFVIVGGVPFAIEDDYPQYLHQLTADLGLTQRVIFTGHLADVRPALAALNIFVHPGDPEPFGLVNVEAMAMAKPVVALSHGALPEIVAPGKTGLLILPGDENGLAQAVLTLLQSPEQQRRLGQAGRERAVTYFTIERVAAAVSEILEKII